MDDDQSAASYALPLYSSVNRNAFGSETEITVMNAALSSSLPDPPPTSSLFDDDSLAQLLADFDAQLTQTMLSLDEEEKYIEEEESNNQHLREERENLMNGVTDEQTSTPGEMDIGDRERIDQQQQEEPPSFKGPGFEGPASSSAFSRNAPTFSSFKGTPTSLHKKMVTFNDRIQTFVRPQSVHDSEVSYNDPERNQSYQQQLQQLPHQQQSLVKKEDEEKEANRYREYEQRDGQSRHDAQSQQPTNESGIYEDVYARQNNSPARANTDRRRYDAIPTGNEPVGYRVKVKTSKEVSNDLQVPREDSVTAAADGNDEFLSLGSEDEDEDEDDDEDTGCMIRETNKESPLTKVKGLTVCRTLAVILAWLLAGIVAELPGPTMEYWSQRFHVREELLSRVLATDGLGIVLGALLGGAASCRRHSDSALAVAMMLLASYPCSYSFPSFQLTAFMCAVGRGAIFVGGLSTVFEMWRESRAAIWVHLLHTAYSIGCFGAVHLATPFIQYLFQVEGRLLLPGPSYQQMGPPPLVDHADNTTANAGDMRNDLFSSDISPNSSTSAASADRIRVSFHVLQVPYAIVCLLLSLFFLCSSIFQTMQSFRRRNSIRRKRLLKQRTRNQQLKREMPEPEQRNENLYEDTQSDKQRGTQTDGSNVSNTTGNRQSEASVNVVESRKSKYAQAKDGFSNSAFTHAPGQEFRTAESKRGGGDASGKRCMDQQYNYKVTPKRTRGKSGVTMEHVPWFQGSQTFDIPILMFLYVCFVFPFGLEATLGMFLSVYASSNNALQQQQQQQQLESADDAALDIDVTVQLLSVFWASFILGRVLAASLSRFLSAGALLIAFLTINVLSSAILAAYADKYPTILFLFVAIFGGFLGPFIPGGFTWANVFLVATPKSIALAYCSAGLGWAICCWLSGFLISYFSKSTLMFLVAGVSSLSVILFIPVLMKVGAPGTRRKGNRSVRKPLSTYV